MFHIGDSGFIAGLARCGKHNSRLSAGHEVTGSSLPLFDTSLGLDFSTQRCQARP